MPSRNTAWNRARLVGCMLLACIRLPWRLARMKRNYDVIWVGFPGHADMPLAWLIGKLSGRPVVFDARHAREWQPDDAD